MAAPESSTTKKRRSRMPPIFDFPLSQTSPWKDLYDSGVVVLPLVPDIEKHTQSLSKQFVDTLNAFPMFKHGGDIKELTTESSIHDPYVWGGFAALGNPGSFHNLFVRRLREWTMFTLVNEVFKMYRSEYLSPDYAMEELLDRMLCRSADKKPIRELMHRDNFRVSCVGPKISNSSPDYIFDSWINLHVKEDQ